MIFTAKIREQTRLAVRDGQPQSSCRRFRTQETGISDKRFWKFEEDLAQFRGGKWPVQVVDYYSQDNYFYRKTL